MCHSFSPLTMHKGGVIITPIFQERKLRLRVVHHVVQDNSDSSDLDLKLEAGLPRTHELEGSLHFPQSTQDKALHRKYLLKECLHFYTSWISHLEARFTFIVLHYSSDIGRLSLQPYVWMNIWFEKEKCICMYIYIYIGNYIYI